MIFRLAAIRSFHNSPMRVARDLFKLRNSDKTPLVYPKQINRRMSAGYSITEFVEKLNAFAPEFLAENWDNVGLLIEPYTPRPIQRVLLTNDLTGNVLEEAIDKNIDFIIAYHPPLFAPFKRIDQNQWNSQMISVLFEQRIAVYSPHTAWDCITPGVNDWLAKAIPHITSSPIAVHPKDPSFGMGRYLNVCPKLSLKDIVEHVKKHLKVPHVQVAVGVNSSLDKVIETAGVCAGSGNSVLKLISPNLYLTGEMSHHELIEAQHKDICVILCNHSNTERGYLYEFKAHFEKTLENSIELIVSEMDADPLVTM